jgi:hypothetical protein
MGYQVPSTNPALVYIGEARATSAKLRLEPREYGWFALRAFRMTRYSRKTHHKYKAHHGDLSTCHESWTLKKDTLSRLPSPVHILSRLRLQDPGYL